MVSMRLITFVFLLVLISACVSTRIAIAATNGNTSTVKGGNSPSADHEKEEAVPTPPQEAQTQKIWARKTMMLRVKEKDMINEEFSKSSSSIKCNEEVSKSSSSAIKCNGKIWSKGKRRINLGGNTNTHDHHVKREDLSSFVTLNADYHPPKSHPPKNN